MSQTPSPAAVSAEDVEAWRAWIGRVETHEEVLDPEALRRFAAAVGADLEVERVQPPLAHWAFFLPVVAGSEIGPDGHPRRGGFLPPVTLPRRMFAAADMGFGARLRLGEPARLTATIADVRHRAGKSGDLVFVEVDRAITQGEETCVAERQTIVYRAEGGRTPAVEPRLQALAPGDMVWTPGPVDLFRFSAVTFNSHRIHYDLPYAREAEGYPGLVVHGPFTAARLHAFAEARAGRRLRTFAFRAQSPMFAGQPIRLTGGEAEGEVRAIRADGTVGMTATGEA
ncbi:MAG: MaoC family dehydratase N-terminal domain-containing protein [Phenylobacterium sp.]|uniref:FAS1-like dehydratase domain-containing protein n=1 Tax=Phenylobacterium sp. TaxID=1871053 RepID=UPI00391C73CD